MKSLGTKKIALIPNLFNISFSTKKFDLKPSSKVTSKLRPFKIFFFI